MDVVLLCAGDTSVHRTNRWHCPDQRNFQLWIMYYGTTPGKYAEDADVYIECKGTKVDLLRHMIPEILRAAPRRLWIPDDDLAIDVLIVNTFFEYAQAYDICQPSLAPRNVSCQDLVTIPGGEPVRSVDFIEIQMPCFSPHAFDVVAQLVLENPTNRSGWGMDCVWSSSALWPNLTKAVINCCVAIHTKPVNLEGGVYAAHSLDPVAEYDAMMSKYALKSVQK